MQQKIDLYEKFDGLGIKCYSCGKVNHLSKKCPDIHMVPDHLEVVVRSLQEQDEIRKQFKRKNTASPLSSPIKKKKFRHNARADCVQIKEDALLYRQCRMICPSQIREFDDNNPTDKKLHRHFKSLFESNDAEEMFLDDSREDEPSVRDKIKLELTNQPTKTLRDITGNKEDETFKSNEKMLYSSLERNNANSLKNHTLLYDIKEKVKEASVILQAKGSKPVLNIFEFSCVKNFDRIQNYEIYFPGNNFDVVVTKINKRSEVEIEKMKNKKQSDEKAKKILLENVIDQPISPMNWKAKERGGKKGRLMLFKSREEISNDVFTDEEKKESATARSKTNDSDLISKILLQPKKCEKKGSLKTNPNDIIENLKIGNITEKSQTIKSRGNEIQNQETQKERSFSNLIDHQNMPLKRSLSNDSMSAKLLNLEKSVSQAEKIFGLKYTKLFVQKFQEGN